MSHELIFWMISVNEGELWNKTLDTLT